MQALKNTLLIGWPDTKEQVPLTVQHYWNFREELTLHNGVLFKNQRIIIPHSLRSEMLARLHSSHLGIDACLRKARDRIYWPNMNTHIKEAVAKCEVCTEYQTANPQQPMQTHKIPQRPWSRVGFRPFLPSFQGLYSSRGLLFRRCGSRPFEEHQLICRDQILESSIQFVLLTDNGPQFISGEFSEFATQWEF